MSFQGFMEGDINSHCWFQESVCKVIYYGRFDDTCGGIIVLTQTAFMVYGLWLMAYGLWLMAYGLWSISKTALPAELAARLLSISNDRLLHLSSLLPGDSLQQTHIGGANAMHTKEHWEKVYSTKTATEVSWFQPHAELSLKLMRNSGVAKTATIIDVGAGASTLVDDLLNKGFSKLTVLDLSAAALTTAQTRYWALF